VHASHPITDAEAVIAAQQLTGRIGGYSERHPDSAGAFEPWAGEQVKAGTPLLVHSYPAIEPSYYYVPLTSPRTGVATFVTLGADDGQWQAFGRQTENAAFPKTTRVQAAERATRELGASVSPGDLIIVSMPSKHLYWYWRDGPPTAPPARELFINLSDPRDIHNGLDEEICPPEPPLPRANEKESGPRAPGASFRYPSSHDITGVPYHVQLTSYNCGPAAAEMVMDYYGPDIDQEEIADVANCRSDTGSFAYDVRRSGHFSEISTAVQDTSLHGYTNRKLGYGAPENRWSHPDTTDADYPDRYNDLKEIISSDLPILLLMWYDWTQSSGHYRVLKGYDDSTDVFIAHDPWYSAPYQGPDVHFNQETFVDDLWTCWYRWGTLISPWEVDFSTPLFAQEGDTLTVTATITYRGPHPFDGQDGAYYRKARINATGSGDLLLAPGETATKALPGLYGSSGAVNVVTWDVIVNASNVSILVQVEALGLIYDSSDSYSSYSDSIGGMYYRAVSAQPCGYTMVDEGGNGDFLTIQDGLDFVTEGDTVCVTPGVYAGPLNRDLHFDGKAVCLMGLGGSTGTIIDCEGEGRGFTLTDGEDASTVIRGFTVTNGVTQGVSWPEDSGGGMLLVGSSPTVEDVVLDSNWAAYVGGGICCVDGASPQLSDCDLTGNIGDSGGAGGMACANGSAPTLTRVKFSDNWTGGYGGGLWCDQGSDASVEYCTFARNTAQYDGGAMLFTSNTTAFVSNCTLIENTGEGAGLSVYGSTPDIWNTIIAFGAGGPGVSCDDDATPSFMHCCVYGNEYGDGLCGIHEGQGNIYEDPLVCDGIGFYLEACSPCEGSGISGEDIGAWGIGCPCGDPTGVDEAIPTRLVLHPARPTPFVGATTMRLDVPRDADRVTLTVYNLSGQVVRTLVDGVVPPGHSDVVWEGTDAGGRPVAAGVYFVRCRSDAGTDAQKLVLLR
jgi:hypothetical protein